MNLSKLKKSEYASAIVSNCETAKILRADSTGYRDVSAFDLAFEAKNNRLPTETELEEFIPHMMDSLGVEQHDSISNVINISDHHVKMLVPELIRSYIRLGVRRAPIYPNIISTEAKINTTTVKQPWLNMSDAAPRYVNEGETIQLGDISYGAKETKIRKMGRGIKFTYEMLQYSTLNVGRIFFEDFGVRLGYALDGNAIDVLFNGDSINGNDSAVVIGVETVGAVSYRDLLRVWIRMARMGKNPSTMVGSEEMAMDILDLPEFKKSNNGAAPEATLRMQTPIPNNANFFIHADVPANQAAILDPSTTMIKYNAQPLLIEEERIVSNQTTATYATLTTGFSILFNDSRFVLDSTESIEDQNFPSYFNPDTLVQETIKYK